LVTEYQPPLPCSSLHTIVSDLNGFHDWSATECVRTLLRHKGTLVWISCLGLLASSLISFLQPRLYESQASIEFQAVNENFLNLRDIYPTAALSADSSGAYIQTQAEILQQDALIERVAEKLHLAGLQDYQDGLSPWDKIRKVTGSSPPLVSPTRRAVDVLKNQIKIVPSRGGRIIRIVCDARDPQLAADLANTLAQISIEQSIEARQRIAQQTHDSLSLQLDQIRNKLLKSEAELNSYTRAPRVISRRGGQRQDTVSSNEGINLTAYNTLKREVDADRRFYELMSHRVDDAGVASAVRQSDIRLIGPAQPASHPYKPNLPLNLAIGAFGSLALAISYVMLREQTNVAVRLPGEAGMYLALPEIGAIPELETRDLTLRRFLSSNEGNLCIGRAALDQQFSGLSESFRGAVASILSAGQDGQHPHILVVTSCQSLEGKTTTVSNLGIALAEISGKVLLIDGDMRRPRLHKVFNQVNSWGLSDVLREKNAIEELPLDSLVQKTVVPHLYLLPSGACVDNIFGLLCSGRMARLLPRFRQEFEYVLVDAPPCLEFADARIMARYAEYLLLVVRANYTEKKMAQGAVQRLLLDGIPVMGVILNRWNPAHSDIYGHHHYYGLNRQELA
jgi:polysaccharide biosynthesis transport protein